MAIEKQLDELNLLVGGDMLVDQFIQDIETSCKKQRIEVDRIDILSVVLREIERIAHEKTGCGSDLLFSVAVKQLEFHGEVMLAAAMRDEVTRVLKEHKEDHGD